MRVRKQDADGDYLWGNGQANFWINAAAGVAQLVETRLRLWEGEWFLDKTVGTPYAQEILGYGTSSLRDIVLKQQILGTQGVTALQSYSSEVQGRNLVVQGEVMTQFSESPVPFGPVVL